MVVRRTPLAHARSDIFYTSDHGMAIGRHGLQGKLLLAEMRRLQDPYRLWNQPNDGLMTPPPEPPAAKKKQVSKN